MKLFSAVLYNYVMNEGPYMKDSKPMPVGAHEHISLINIVKTESRSSLSDHVAEMLESSASATWSETMAERLRFWRQLNR